MTTILQFKFIVYADGYKFLLEKIFIVLTHVLIWGESWFSWSLMYVIPVHLKIEWLGGC